MASITKLQAAERQLEVALRMLFAGADEIAVHTLVGAASNILSDLVEIRAPKRSWDRVAQEENQLTPAEFYRVMRVAQNFFKHAEREPDAVLEFDAVDTDHLAFWAVLNLAEIGQLGIAGQVFQLWYLAVYTQPDRFLDPVLKQATVIVGNIAQLPRAEQLVAGMVALERASAAENWYETAS